MNHYLTFSYYSHTAATRPHVASFIYTQSDSFLGEAPRLEQTAINSLEFITINNEARRIYPHPLSSIRMR